MKQIHPNLYVGPHADFQALKDDPSWSFVRAGFEFYPNPSGSSEDAPPIRVDNQLLLFLRDAVVEIDIPRSLYDTALTFIDEQLAAGRKVLIHCSQGVSRSASIGMLYLASRTDTFTGQSFKSAVVRYDEIYPPLNLGVAIKAFLQCNWESYNCHVL